MQTNMEMMIGMILALAGKIPDAEVDALLSQLSRVDRETVRQCAEIASDESDNQRRAGDPEMAAGCDAVHARLMASIANPKT